VRDTRFSIELPDDSCATAKELIAKSNTPARIILISIRLLIDAAKAILNVPAYSILVPSRIVSHGRAVVVRRASRRLGNTFEFAAELVFVSQLE
jgi:hypothetical protein